MCTCLLFKDIEFKGANLNDIRTLHSLVFPVKQNEDVFYWRNFEMISQNTFFNPNSTEAEKGQSKHLFKILKNISKSANKFQIQS